MRLSDLASDRGEINTIGIFFWIVIIVAVLGAVGTLFKGQMEDAVRDVSSSIGDLFNGQQ